MLNQNATLVPEDKRKKKILNGFLPLNWRSALKLDAEKKIKGAENYGARTVSNPSLGVDCKTPSKEKVPDKTLINHKKENVLFLDQKIQRQKEKPTETIRDTDASINETSLIKNTVSDGGDINYILRKAQDLKKLELYSEASAEYEKALRIDSGKGALVPADIVKHLFDCRLCTEAPRAALNYVRPLIEKYLTADQARAKALVAVAEIIAGKNRPLLAEELYEDALSLDPANKSVSNRLKTLKEQHRTNAKFSFLLNKDIITTDQLQKALAKANTCKCSVEKMLLEEYRVKQEALGQSLSLHYDCPYRSYDPDVPVPVELTGKLKKAFLLHHAWVPLKWNKEGVEVLVDDPMDLRKTDHIKALLDVGKINFSVGIREDIIRYIERFFETRIENIRTNAVDDLASIIPDVTFEEENDDEKEIEIIDESSSHVVRFVDQVLITAYRQNVSDIHIEPSPANNMTAIRFRMDGVCQEYVQVPNIMAPGILSRLKILANLDIAERRLPQDGKIKIKRKGVPSFELRLSTMPTAGGKEDAVLRILAKAGAMALDEMGLNDRNLNVLKNIIVKPYGLILVVGPTGSGKTTTLHSALGHINKPEIKIWTVEDPVEITQPGLRQVEAKPRIGLNFARIMRGLLRLDPDVIMIGEMRDEETASIGIEASLTGHLVFSTLHTNSAPETVTRLLDMGLNALNFSDAFLGVLAQRLIRRLCPTCRKKMAVSEQMFNDIRTEYGQDHFDALGIEYGNVRNYYAPGGCEQCSSSGYRGRLAIHELMEGTKACKSLIKTRASTEQLFEQAFEDGMTTLKQDAISKLLAGHTDMSEVRRVCID